MPSHIGDGELALLVHIRFQKAGFSSNYGRVVRFKDIQREFRELCESAGARIAGVVVSSRYAPDPKYFTGKGKAEEIALEVRSSHAGLVIFNHTLSPVQERNLEKLLKCRVLGRTGLILGIFAKRARSFEGKLQVELAQLHHLSTRLVRGWTHLERQKGGIGLRGPGEAQLETDHRLISVRIKKLISRLEKVRLQREQGRSSRQQAKTPVVALVGYTNAGKSTLFNQMTSGKVYAADQLFATLDPTLRRVDLKGGSHIILADTVGFIRDLPHELVTAFRSTLTETRDADLLLHVVDASREDRDDCIMQVQTVLTEVNAGKPSKDADQPVLMVYNKADLISRNPGIDRNKQGRPVRIWLSAYHSDGLEYLLEALTEIFRNQKNHGWIKLGPEESALRAELYQRNVVQSEAYDEQGQMVLEISIHDRDLESIGLMDRLQAVTMA